MRLDSHGKCASALERRNRTWAARATRRSDTCDTWVFLVCHASIDTRLPWRTSAFGLISKRAIRLKLTWLTRPISAEFVTFDKNCGSNGQALSGAWRTWRTSDGPWSDRLTAPCLGRPRNGSDGSTMSTRQASWLCCVVLRSARYSPLIILRPLLAKQSLVAGGTGALHAIKMLCAICADATRRCWLTIAASHASC